MTRTLPVKTFHAGKPSGTIMTKPNRFALFLVRAAMIWFALALPAAAATPQPAQATFASPEDAAAALMAAERTGNTVALAKILGPSGHDLIYSGDPVADEDGRANFVAHYDQKHALDKGSDTKATLVIGANEWPFPIPVVKKGAAWHFDTDAGADEILNRRIGRNELNAIKVCAAIVEAEHEYAGKDRTGSGFLEYAQKFMSSPGKHDGLYWPGTGAEESPIGPLVVSARAEGYGPGPTSTEEKHEPYHGYFYKILMEQGPDAPGGAYSYVVNGHMIGGFALVAFPAKYGDSGVMTFMVNHDGIVYEKNLGPQTAASASAMTVFDPDSSWKAVP